jgi:hypothetical protein
MSDLAYPYNNSDQLVGVFQELMNVSDWHAQFGYDLLNFNAT